MKMIENFIENIISEAALDARIHNGMVDVKNIEHIQVIAEIMYDKCEDETLVNEFVRKFINEGKYPDRQAYNKDGWLVTFPSKEYRDAAIKRGTHAISDPTHGKGGMNLYYKKRGKQKRQTQQAATATQQTQPAQQVPATPPAKPTQPVQPTAKSPTQSPQATPTAVTNKSRMDRLAKITGKQPSEPIKPEPSIQQPQPTDTDKEPSAPKPVEAPAIDVPVVTTPPEQYSSISKKFADKKGWIAEPYGEYRDAEGNTIAVVGLSGEVVPIKSVDRDEYKIFAEKNMT